MNNNPPTAKPLPHTAPGGTVAEVATYTGFSPGFLYTVMRRGELPFIRLDHSRRILWTEVHAWLATRNAP